MTLDTTAQDNANDNADDNQERTHYLRRRRVSTLSPALAKALKSEPIHNLDFKTSWTANFSDPESSWELFTLKGVISLEVLREIGRKFDRFEEDEVVVAAASGFIIRPSVAAAQHYANLWDAYDGPSDFSAYLYERIYGEDEHERDGLLKEVCEIMGDDMWAGTIPERHCHIETIQFADGFASRQDLGVLLDNMSMRFGGCTPSEGLLTVDGKAVPGYEAVEGSSGHEMLEAAGLMEQYGFSYLNDLFIHRSMLAAPEKARTKRIRALVQSRRLRRTPL